MPKKKKMPPTLKVVFDSSVLHVGEMSLGSATDLMKQEAVELISAARYPDLNNAAAI